MNIQQLKQKILSLAIQGQLVSQDEGDEPAAVLLEKIRVEKQELIKNKTIKKDKNASYITSHTTPYRQYTEHFADGSTNDITHQIPFEIPENWAWCRLGEVSSLIQYGVSKSAKPMGKYKLLRITDIQENNVNWENVPFAEINDEEAEKFILKNGDILFARTGATVGKSYLVKNLSDISVFASYLIRIRIYDDIDIDFIKYLFETSFYWEQITDKSVGIGQPNVNGTTLSNFLFPLPPLAEQQRIVAKVEELFALADTIETNKTDLKNTLKQTKAKVLSLAIRGKLVPQDENDPPATELLKSIASQKPKSPKKPTDNAHYR